VACTAVAALLLFTFAPTETMQSSVCNVTPIEFNQVAKLLESVDQERNLEQERRITERALRAVKKLAGKTRKCSCEKPTASLDAAAVDLRQAREVGSYLQISKYVHRAIDEINASAGSMETCGLK